MVPSPFTPTEQIALSHASRVEALMWRTNTPNSPEARAAARNLTERKPAFWSRATTGNSVGLNLLEAANRLGSVKAAMDECASWSTGNYRDEYQLDQLLPLNEPAVHALADAYGSIGTFRTARELFERTDKAEETPITNPRVAEIVALHAQKAVAA